jgi:hypothetical protein
MIEPDVFYFAAQQTARRRVHQLEFGDGGIAQSLDFGKPRDRRGDHFRKFYV